jgi:hypothetical protein
MARLPLLECDNCPECGNLWDYGDVLDVLKEQNPEKTDEEIKKLAESCGWSETDRKRFTRLIAVTEKNDVTNYWECPYCTARWNREGKLVKEGVSAEDLPIGKPYADN